MNDDKKISDVNSSQNPQAPSTDLNQPVVSPVAPVGSLNKEAAPIVAASEMTSETPTIIAPEVEKAGIKEVKDYQPIEHVTISEKPSGSQPIANVKANKFSLPETFFEVKQMLKLNKKVSDAGRWFATLAEKIFKLKLQQKSV